MKENKDFRKTPPLAITHYYPFSVAGTLQVPAYSLPFQTQNQPRWFLPSLSGGSERVSGVMRTLSSLHINSLASHFQLDLFISAHAQCVSWGKISISKWYNLWQIQFLVNLLNQKFLRLFLHVQLSHLLYIAQHCKGQVLFTVCEGKIWKDTVLWCLTVASTCIECLWK